MMMTRRAVLERSEFVAQLTDFRRSSPIPARSMMGGPRERQGGRLRLKLMVALLIGLPTAQACWSGHSVSHGKVSLNGAGESMDVHRERAYGVWLPRINALLPSGALVRAAGGPDGPGYGDTQYCQGDDCTPLDWNDTLPALFEAVRLKTGADAASTRAAMAAPRVTPLTVQVGQGSDAWARALATRLNRDLRSAYLPLGFTRYGGAPVNPWVAWVVPRKGKAAVVIGAFDSRPAAEALAARLSTDHGLAGFVRAL